MKVLELPLPYETPRGIVLPHCDDYGVAYGTEYEPFEKARKPRRSTRTVSRGLKFQRRLEALSMNEQRALLRFTFHPYVLDIREQYPCYRREHFDQAALNGTRMRRVQIMTVDLVLTLVLPPGQKIHHHVVSIKDDNDDLPPAEQRRQIREEARFAERGWTWELLRGGRFSYQASANHRVMFRTIRDTNVFHHYEASKVFADVLKSRSRRGTMDDVVHRAARKTNISDSFAHRLFAVAAVFGFIYPDETKPLLADKPLYLLF